MNIGGEAYISLEEAAVMCGCQARKISEAASAGLIAWCRPGRKKLLALRGVEEWLAAQVRRPRETRNPGRPRGGTIRSRRQA